MAANELVIERVVVGEPTIKHLKFKNEFWNEAGQLFVDDVRRRILRQQKADGTRIESNRDSTRESKRRRNKPQLSLVDENRALVKRKGYDISIGRNAVTIEIAVDYGIYVQEGGRGRKRYTGWFGPSKDFYGALRGLIDEEIGKAARRARKQRKTIRK